MRTIIILVLVAVFLFPALALGQKLVSTIPHMINYQGMLTDDGGAPLNGPYDMVFKIYNHPTSGTLRWQETQNDVAVFNGLFNVILGSVALINVQFYEEYWLDITVQGEHMPDRVRLTSVGYAYRAQNADTALLALTTESYPHNHDDTYVNVIGPDSLRYTGTAYGFLVKSYAGDGISIYCPYPGVGDGIYVDSAGDNGIEITQVGTDGIYMDNIHDDGIHMTDVVDNGIYMHDVGDHGIYLDDMEMCGVYINDAAASGIYVKLASYGVYVDSTRAGGNGFWIDYAEEDGLRVDHADDDGVYVSDAGGDGMYVYHADRYGVYVYDSDDDGIRVESADGDGIVAYGEDGGGELWSLHLGNYGLQVHSKDNNSAYAGLRVFGYGSITGVWSTKLSGSSGDVPGYMVTSTDVEVMASGTGTLVNGQALISFEEDFSQAISGDIPVKVVLTAQGAPSGLLYVDSKSNQGFGVRRLEIPDLNLKSDDVTFDWIAIGRQKGYEQRPQIIMEEEGGNSAASQLTWEEEVRARELEHQEELKRDALNRQQMLEKEAEKEARRIQEEREQER